MATILVVEDNDDVREMMTVTLELEGHEVYTAANGRQALAQLENGLRPCVILLDLMMPVMNGWEFRSALQRDERFKDIPVVVVSAAGGGDRQSGDRPVHPEADRRRYAAGCGGRLLRARQHGTAATEAGRLSCGPALAAVRVADDEEQFPGRIKPSSSRASASISEGSSFRRRVYSRICAFCCFRSCQRGFRLLHLPAAHASARSSPCPRRAHRPAARPPKKSASALTIRRRRGEPGDGRLGALAPERFGTAVASRRGLRIDRRRHVRRESVLCTIISALRISSTHPKLVCRARRPAVRGPRSRPDGG